MKALKRKLAKDLGVEEWQIDVCSQLLRSQNTVPFIATYRKEMTGGLQSWQVRKIQVFLEEKRELKEFTLRVLQQHGELAPAMVNAIKNADSKERLSDLLFSISNLTEPRIL